MGFGSQLGRENRPKIHQKSIPKGIRKMIGKKGPLGSVLEASWGSKIHWNRLEAAARGWRRLHAAGGGRGGGDAGATPRKDSERIRIIRKEYHKEVSKERRLEYGTPYAMRRHKAWRGGSKAQQSCVPATALGG